MMMERLKKRYARLLQSALGGDRTVAAELAETVEAMIKEGKKEPVTEEAPKVEEAPKKRAAPKKKEKATK